jgi:hypothetical protein
MKDERMDSPENGTEQLARDLTRSLHERVDRMGDAPISLHDVQGRARSIKRRRRITAAAGIAAAAAVLVPTAMLAIPGAERSEAPPAGPTPTQVTPDHAKAGGEGLDVGDLPVGEAPVIGYLDLTDTPTIVEPGGRRLPLDTEGEPSGYASLLDGRYVVVTEGEGGSLVEVVGPDGTSRATYPRTGGIVLGQDSDQVAWAAPDGTVQVLQVGAAEPRPLGTLAGPAPAVVSLAGSGDCFADVPPGTTGGCIVAADVNEADGNRLGWVISSAGADGPIHSGDGRPEDPAILSVADFTTLGDPPGTLGEDYGEMVAGITEVKPDGTCSGVYGPTPQRVTDWLVETCDHRFGTFSPDASRITAWEAYGDGLGHVQVGMYDVSSGELLWDRVATEPGMAFVHSATWEDDGHLLAPAYQDGEWHLVRFGPKGEMELAAEPVAGADTDVALVPEIQP